MLNHVKRGLSFTIPNTFLSHGSALVLSMAVSNICCVLLAQLALQIKEVNGGGGDFLGGASPGLRFAAYAKFDTGTLHIKPLEIEKS